MTELQGSSKIKVLFILFTFLFATNILAQVPVQLQDIQNASGILNKINSVNISRSQMDELLGDNNRKESEMGRDRDAASEVKIIRDTVNPIRETSKVLYNPESTYGANIFFNAAVTNVAELSTPPLDYPIGVGDHIVVALWGAAEFQESYVVAKDGAIFPQGIGKINVAGFTFDEARTLIISKFKKVVPGATRISVSLGQPRTINVNVVGEVLNPGPAAVSAFSNAFNVIAAAGGVTEYGNLRNIQIKRAGKVIDEIDVYQYLSSGDFGKHQYLQNNDFVVVGFVNKKVLASGQFKRPMYYQLKSEEGLKALCKYSGGFSSGSAASVIKVIRSENEKKIQRDINAMQLNRDSLKDFILLDGDVIRVDAIRPELMNKVEIRGEVNYPGEYELKEGESLYDIINRAGGINMYTVLEKAFIFRGFGDSTKIAGSKLEVDLSGFLTGIDTSGNGNIKLMPQDIIQILSKKDFEEGNYVEIFGEVRKLGKVKSYVGMTLQDLLYLSGGLKPSAENGRIEIASVIFSDKNGNGAKAGNVVLNSYAIAQDLHLDSVAAKIQLNPFDQVFVRKNPDFELQENIELKGMLKFPGSYTRLKKNETISSYIQRAGGFLPNANVGGALLLRTQTENLRERLIQKNISDTSLLSSGTNSFDQTLQNINEPVSIDLYNAMKNPLSKYDIVLHKGDILIVPEINPFVSVNGQVQSPIRVTFDKSRRNIGYYIDKSGGYGVKPWRKRIFVTYANGRSRKTTTFMFIKFHPKVQAGSSVYVPQRPQNQSLGDIAKTTLVSTLPALLAAVILRVIN